MMVIPSRATEVDRDIATIAAREMMKIDPRNITYIDLSLIDYAFPFSFSSNSKATVTPLYRFRTNSTRITLNLKCIGNDGIPVTVYFYRSPVDFVSRTTITLHANYFSQISFTNLSANIDYYFMIENHAEVNTTISCTVAD